MVNKSAAPQIDSQLKQTHSANSPTFDNSIGTSKAPVPTAAALDGLTKLTPPPKISLESGSGDVDEDFLPGPTLMVNGSGVLQSGAV
jgi:hypothetical protein